MKVLVVSYLFPNAAHPGYGIFVLNRIRAVSAACAITVIAPVQWYPFMRWLRAAFAASRVPVRETIAGLDVHHPRFAVIPRICKWIDALTFHAASSRTITRLREREQLEFQLIDVHWSYPDLYAASRLARRYGVPYIVTIRGHEAFYEEEHTLRRRMVSRLLKQASAVVALSPELRDKLIERGVDAQRVHVIMNGVDVARFRPHDRLVARARLGLPLDRRILLTVGRLTEAKGHQTIIRALAKLAQHEPVSLYIIGGVNPEDDFGARLRSLILQLGLDEVHLIDGASQDMLSYWYAAADVFCLGTHREGCPNVVLEALACGTPVVASAVGAIPQMVRDDESGYLAPAQDVAAFTAAIERALHRNWDREAIAASMLDWSWESCAQRVRDLYAHVVGREA